MLYFAFILFVRKMFKNSCSTRFLCFNKRAQKKDKKTWQETSSSFGVFKIGHFFLPPLSCIVTWTWKLADVLIVSARLVDSRTGEKKLWNKANNPNWYFWKSYHLCFSQDSKSQPRCMTVFWGLENKASCSAIFFSVLFWKEKKNKMESCTYFSY